MKAGVWQHWKPADVLHKQQYPTASSVPVPQASDVLNLASVSTGSRVEPGQWVQAPGHNLRQTYSP
jgi:hypothetical protein